MLIAKSDRAGNCDTMRESSREESSGSSLLFRARPQASGPDFGLFLKMIAKDSPPRRLITTSSVRAILSTSESRCLASEYVYLS
jgi:hypothetical protein